MKILFVCNQGKYRSKTAQELFKNKYETDSAGIYSEDNPLTEEKMINADLIIVMEDLQRKFIADNYPKIYLSKRILSWNIKDTYGYMQSELINIIKSKFKDLI